MPQHQDQSPPSDVCLLLRAYAEQRWLSREVVPVLSQLESPAEIPPEQLGAALAYLEVIWIEARRHAAETDAAFAELEYNPSADGALPSKALRYHSAVGALREAVARHVERLLSAPASALSDPAEEPPSTDSALPDPAEEPPGTDSALPDPAQAQAGHANEDDRVGSARFEAGV